MVNPQNFSWPNYLITLLLYLFSTYYKYLFLSSDWPGSAGGGAGHHGCQWGWQVDTAQHTALQEYRGTPGEQDWEHYFENHHKQHLK